MNATQLFRQTEKMMYSAAWKYSRQYRKDFDDLKSQAFLIFTEAIHRYNADAGASFPTFLFSRLRTLKDYCVKGANQTVLSLEDFHDVIARYDADTDRVAFNDAAQRALSADGHRVYSALVSGEFHGPAKKWAQKPVTKADMTNVTVKDWGWSFSRSNSAIAEVQSWYKGIANGF